MTWEVKFLRKQRKRGDCKNEYFGHVKSCPRMLLILPESSSGRSVCFCAVGAAPHCAWLGAVLHQQLSGESAALCVCVQQTMCRIAGLVFLPFQETKEQTIPLNWYFSPQQKHFIATSYKQLVSQADSQTPGLFSAHRGVCLLLNLHVIKPGSTAEMQGSRKGNSSYLNFFDGINFSAVK